MRLSRARGEMGEVEKARRRGRELVRREKSDERMAAKDMVIGDLERMLFVGCSTVLGDEGRDAGELMHGLGKVLIRLTGTGCGHVWRFAFVRIRRASARLTRKIGSQCLITGEDPIAQACPACHIGVYG